MAILFYEPGSSETAPSGDQIDGHFNPPGPTIVTTATSSFSQPNSNFFSDNPTDNGQLLAWKIIAIAMCKALKEYYQEYYQDINTPQLFTSSDDPAPGQMLTNNQTHSLWK